MLFSLGSGFLLNTKFPFLGCCYLQRLLWNFVEIRMPITFTKSCTQQLSNAKSVIDGAGGTCVFMEQVIRIQEGGF